MGADTTKTAEEKAETTAAKEERKATAAAEKMRKDVFQSPSGKAPAEIAAASQSSCASGSSGRASIGPPRFPVASRQSGRCACSAAPTGSSAIHTPDR